MKPNELRIGNIIYGNYTEEDEQGNEVEKKAICTYIGYDHFDNFIWVETLDTENYADEYDDFDPVPIEYSKLVRIGFLPHHIDELSIVFGRYAIVWNPSSGIRLEYEGKAIPMEFKYIHQIQNQYFLLSGHELPYSK